MAYIRIKNVPYGSDNYYRYLVKGQREGDDVKQKVIKYLGPAKGPKDHSIHEDDDLDDLPDDIEDKLGTTGADLDTLVEGKKYHEIYRESMDSGDEIGYIIADDGRKVKISGDGQSIDSKEVREKLREFGPGSSFIHTHPQSNKAFSPSDMMEFTMTSNLQTMGLITKDGTIYEIKKPKRKKKYGFDEVDKTKRRYKDARKRAVNVKQHDPESKEYYDYSIQHFGKKYDIEYNRSELGTTGADLDG